MYVYILLTLPGLVAGRLDEQECSVQQVGVLAFVVLGTLGLMMACCCLCVINSRLIIITGGIQFNGCVGTVLEILCCLPSARVSDGEREERLLGAEEAGAEGADEGEEEEDYDPVGKGYLPPGITSLLTAPPGLPSHTRVCISSPT